MDEEIREGEPQGTDENYDYDLFAYASMQNPAADAEQGQANADEQQPEPERETPAEAPAPLPAPSVTALPAAEPETAAPSAQEDVAAPSAEAPSEEAAPDEEEKDEEEREDDEHDTEGMKISSDLIRGHINTIILRALYDGDKYGYEILAEIEKKSHGQYSLKQPSLYSALKRLEREGYVTSYWGGSVGGGRRKYFSLTDDGKAIAEKNQSEWEYSRTVIDSLISDKDFDFNEPAPGIVDMRMLRRSTSRVPDRTLDEDEEYDGDDDEVQAQEEEMERRQTEFEEQRSRIEEELHAREEELRVREERLRAEEEARRQAIEQEEARIREKQRRAAEEEAKRLREEQAALDAAARQEEEEQLRRLHEARLQEEQALREAEARRSELNDEIARREEEEAARASALAAEKEQQNARILEMEGFIQERAQYEERLKQQEAMFKAKHERELAEQEKRIRAEDERLFREREQQMIHQNYLNLMKPPAEPEQPPMFYDAEVQSTRPKSEPTTERSGYRSVIQKLFMNTVKAPSDAQNPPPPPAQPTRSSASPAHAAATYTPNAPAREAQREPTYQNEPQADIVPVGKIDFYDLETRAAQDGIRIRTSGGRIKTEREASSYSLVHKGRALFFSALVVFLMCIAEGSVALGLQSSLGLPRFFPYFIWGTGLALLLVAGLAYLNHYGERALRQTGNLLTNTIVTYALCVILVLIVALTARIDFTDAGQLASYVIFPVIYFFGIVVFGFVYYAQIRPTRES